MDLSPFGESGKTFDLSPGDLDPTNSKSRAEHINAYLLYMFPEAPKDHFEGLRLLAIESACRSISKKGHQHIGALFFEYWVDQTHWVHSFSEHRDSGQAPDWPWAKYRPNPTDMKDGRSETYHEWLKAQNTDTADTGTTDPKTVATNTADTVTADPDTTENSDSMPDGLTLENLSFTYKAGSEEAVVEILNHLAGLSPSGELDVNVCYRP